MTACRHIDFSFKIHYFEANNQKKILKIKSLIKIKLKYINYGVKNTVYILNMYIKQ